MTMYALGRRIGDAVFDPDRLRWLPKKRIGKARDWLHRWGYGGVAANRFLSGARSVIALTVGMARMHAGKTAAFATLSAAVWCALISYAGYAVGENWEVVASYLRTYGHFVIGLLVLLVLIQAARYYRRRVRKQKGEAASQRLD
jgi:membrane protein DedA with SNARE-associated domain